MQRQRCRAGPAADAGGTNPAIGGANNIRLHFSTFDVAAGSTRTGKDYLRLLKGDGTTVVADLTGNLGDF